MWERLQEVLEFQYPYEDIAQVFNIDMGITDVWTDIDFYAEERFHPTQKPVALIDRLIRASTNEGMTVLDPFMGTGSTAISCIKLNRHYIGIEKEEKYVLIAEERIKELKSKNIQDKPLKTKLKNKNYKKRLPKTETVNNTLISSHQLLLDFVQE